MVCAGADQAATQTCAAAQIPHALKAGRRVCGQVLQQHAVALVTQLPHQVGFKVIGVLVKQFFHIRGWRIHHGLLRTQGGQVVAVQFRVSPQVQGPLVARDRLRGLAHVALHMGHLAPGFGQVRVVRQGLLKGQQGLWQAPLVREALAPAQTKVGPVCAQRACFVVAKQSLRPIAQGHLRHAPGLPGIGLRVIGVQGLAQTHIGPLKPAQLHAAHAQIHEHRGSARGQLQSFLEQRCSRLEVVAFKLFDAGQKSLAGLFD